MALVTGQVAVAASAVPVVTMPPGPCSLTLSNSGTATAFIGTSSSVTATTGWALPTGAAPVTILGFAGSGATSVYAISGTTATVSYILSTDR